MKQKQKLLLSTIICLVASAVALTSFTFAWFTQDHAMNNVITLTSGDTEAKVEAHIYERLFPTSGGTSERAYFVDSTSSLNMTQYANTSGNINVRFSSDLMLDYDLLNAYANENAVSAITLPSFYVELRVIKPSSYGYMGLKMVFQSVPSALSTELDLSSVYPFAYRSLAVNNSLTTPLVSALPTQISALEAKTSALFFNTPSARAGGITLFDASDLAGAPITSTTGLAPQRYIPGFAPKVNGSHVFATSVMLQIYLEPLALFKFIREHTNVMNTSMRLGIEFTINAQYSNNPIQA
ncbi:MAG: hypothetical protein NTV44_03480 [Firmicutes bacterium]|nr:hypothetical protein [Bacillota bacterium]